MTVASSSQAGEKRRPNILLIYTDDQSYRTLSCYRQEGAWPWVKTPNLDRLAARGVKFSHAYGAAWCTPSRACLLTGRHQHAIAGMNMQAVLKGSYDPDVCRFWPALLRQAGYLTAMIGKWHIGPDAGHGRNWDHSVVWDQADIKGDWYNNQLLQIDGAPKKAVPGYSTDVYTRCAADFVHKKHDRPWLLWLCYNAPHLPMTVAPRHKDLYAGAEVDIPPNVFGPRPGLPQWQQAYSQWKGDASLPLYNKRPLPELVRDYNRLVAAVDEGVGELLRVLEETGQVDNTLIVFTSDQGFAWGEHGFAWKVGPYAACLRMPLLMAWPGKAAPGGVCPHPVGIVDVARTAVAAAGVAPAWKMHGHDLTPLLKDPGQAWAKPLLLEQCRWEFGAQTDRGGPALGNVPWWVALRDGKYHYIRALVEGEIDELYDLERDPHERHNLAVEPQHRALLQTYRGRLLEELRRTEAGMVEHLPRLKE